jgi:hypothetical protein
MLKHLSNALFYAESNSRVRRKLNEETRLAALADLNRVPAGGFRECGFTKLYRPLTDSLRPRRKTSHHKPIR